MEVTCAYSLLDQANDPAARRVVPAVDRCLVAASFLAAPVCLVFCSWPGRFVGDEPADCRRALGAFAGVRTGLEP
ncbi:hypothetical protein D9M73_233550 [compost metagenome]